MGLNYLTNQKILLILIIKYWTLITSSNWSVIDVGYNNESQRMNNKEKGRDENIVSQFLEQPQCKAMHLNDFQYKLEQHKTPLTGHSAP